jgi:5-phospho-D-xylono-1,4-lactonase
MLALFAAGVRPTDTARLDMRDQVMTVLGPIGADELGVVDAHDHLFLATPAIPGQEFTDLQLSVVEAGAARDSGIGTIVEMTPIGCGRRPDLLRALSSRVGVQVIAATGYHRDAHYPAGHWVNEASVEELVACILTDLRDGMHPADWIDTSRRLDPARAGAIKAGASYHRITRSEERRMVAAAVGVRTAGVPVLVHLEVGTCAHDVIDLLEREGVTPDRIILAHLDRNPDAELHAEVASRGVMLEYDTVGRIKYKPDSELLDLVGAVVAAGHLDQLLLGLDLGRRDSLRAYDGGPGMRYLMDVFAPRLRRRIGDAAVQQILVGNPARAYAVASPVEAGS